MPTVIDIDSHASRIDGDQRLKMNGTGILTPAENREMRTAISVRVSSTLELCTGSKRNRFNTIGPSTTPTTRYTIADVTGSREIVVAAMPRASIRQPINRNQSVVVMRAFVRGK